MSGACDEADTLRNTPACRHRGLTRATRLDPEPPPCRTYTAPMSSTAHRDAATTPVANVHVHRLRQVLLWPLRLIPAGIADDAEQRRAPWQLLRQLGDATPWREHFDEYGNGAGGFHERHYNEFVTFLPYVQRFLYGEGRARRGGDSASSGSPMRVFRRRDIAAVRVVPRAGDAPITLQVVHVDLYFFYGVDIVLLNVEVAANDLPLAQAQELMYRFGRSRWVAFVAACATLLRAQRRLRLHIPLSQDRCRLQISSG